MRRRLTTLLAMVVAMMALGAGTAMADPFGPIPAPEGCGRAAAVTAIEEQGLGFIVSDPPEITPALVVSDFAQGDCM